MFKLLLPSLYEPLGHRLREVTDVGPLGHPNHPPRLLDRCDVAHVQHLLHREAIGRVYLLLYRLTLSLRIFEMVVYDRGQP